MYVEQSTVTVDYWLYCNHEPCRVVEYFCPTVDDDWCPGCGQVGSFVAE